MVLDFFAYRDARSFFDRFEFENMEPFTMIIRDRRQLFEARWDEEKLHIFRLNPNEHFIWSSATLYDQEAQSKRQLWFDNWLSTVTDINSKSIWDFHLNAGDGDPHNDVVMNREGLVQTVSITGIEQTKQGLKMVYQDLLYDQIEEAKISFSSEVVEATEY